MTTTTGSPTGVESRLVYHAPEQLRPHPVYLKTCGPIAVSKIPSGSADSPTVIEPVLVTKAGLILDGYWRWTVALHRNRPPLLACIEYDLTDEAALAFILAKHRRSDRVNDFCRISMALALEPHWRAKARQHQQQGGAGKLSSNLTTPHAIDVRAESARAAGVGAGNVTKVKQLLETATPEVREALRRGEIRIHRAWQWRQLGPGKQNEQLRQYRHRKDLRHTIRNLLLKHTDERDNVLSIEQFAALLAAPAQGKLANTALLVADLPGRAIVVTRDLYDTLRGRRSFDSHGRATA